MKIGFEWVEKQPEEVAANTGPHLWIQWKGTDLCADFNCECGRCLHFDGEYAYALKCGGCGARFAMPQAVKMYRIPDEAEWIGGSALTVEDTE